MLCLRCFKESKAVTPDQMEVWKSWAKMTKAVIGSPSECQKQRVFRGVVDVDEKRGGGRGGQKCRILQEIRGSKWSNPVSFECCISSRIQRVWRV